MTVKLTEIYNTRYFYVTYKDDLTYLFSRYLSLRNGSQEDYNAGNDLIAEVFKYAKEAAEVVFDLANAKFTPDTVPVIMDYARKGIKFIDSQDFGRNEQLAENARRFNVDVESATPLPAYDPAMSIKDYIKNLDSSVTYSMPQIQEAVYIPLVTMIIMLRPTVKILLTNHDMRIMRYVASKLPTNVLDEYDEFYYATDEGVSIVKKTNGKIYHPELGACDFTKAPSFGALVPTIFGKKQLHKSADWIAVFQHSLNTLNGYRNSRPRTLKEVFE